MGDQTTTVIPDTLLAAAKDRRYVNTLTNLLSEVVSPYYYVTQSSLGSTVEEAASCLRPEISLLARLLHSYIVMKEGKSLGLDHLGLGYSQYALRIRVFALLYTIPPYIIERAGRNGWNDLRNIRSSLSLIRKTSRGNTVEREQLRGGDRRRVYEEMRQRMLQRALDRASNDTRNVQRNNDQHGSNIDNPLSSTAESQCNENVRTWKQVAIKMRVLLQKILGQMAIASQIRSPIPHELSNSNTNETDGTVPNYSLRVERLAVIFKWLIRLNLALFYANGKYPSILHRLSGLQIEKKNTSINIIAERPAYNVIGLMILGQGCAKLVQAVVEVSVDAWYAGKRRIDDAQPQSISEKIEARVPSNDSSQKIDLLPIRSPPSTINCGICMNERKHPSAPIGCGHVFCWHCIQHWIATVRHECPFCRSPTRPQDVIVLYNYDPH
jgi:peroxin-10